MEINIPNIEERKENLTKTLESLKKDKLSEDKFIFMADSGDLQKIDTKMSIETNGIIANQFIVFILNKKQSSICSDIYLCVGMGKGCEENSCNDYIWFLKEGDGGISYFKDCINGVETKKKLEEEIKKYFNLSVSIIVI